MERLTFEGNFCDIAQCRELPCPYNSACSQRKVWERLKAYEDTGLEPAEVHSIVDAAPTVDAEVVVRCKDCYQSVVIGNVLHCTYWSKDTDENGYCHEGG